MNKEIMFMDDNKKHSCIGKDELLVQTKGNIEKYGLQVIMVKGTSYLPSFAYSIGLFETYNHPEVICFGLSEELGHQIINDVADLLKNEKTIKIYTNYNNIFSESRAEFIPVDDNNINDYFGAALNYYDTIKFSAIQLIWTDRNDKFPWESGFEEEFTFTQPLLDRNIDFKFRESRTLAIFTTRQWLDLDKTILHVVHDENGDWQFLTGDQMPDDIKIVSLEELVTRDHTLNQVFDLDYGVEASREFIGGEWTRTKTGKHE